MARYQIKWQLALTAETCGELIFLCDAETSADAIKLFYEACPRPQILSIRTLEPIVSEPLIRTSESEAAIIAASPLAEDYRQAEDEALFAICAVDFTFSTPLARRAWEELKSLHRHILAEG
jgi:hypothetical protein